MKRARKPTWSFVVMRGADKSVKQFSVTKRSVVAAPLAAVLAVSGTIAGLQLKAAYELKHLEDELSTQSAHFTQTITGMDDVIAGKDEAIVSLQQEILELSRQAQELKDKMQQLNELEEKLKQFIEKYGSSITDTGAAGAAASAQAADGASASLRSSSGSSSTAAGLRTDAGGSAVRMLSASGTQDTVRIRTATPPPPLSLARIATLAQQTELDLRALGAMVDAMEISMEQTLAAAQHRRRTVDAYPSFWPTRSKQLTSGFGYRRDPFTGRATFHAGIDIGGKSGDAVFSAADGTVSEVGYDPQYGNYVAIDHLGGLQTIYMHLRQIDARKGDSVVRGEKIGQIGSSGRSTGPHLHFQIMQRSEPVNPLNFLAKHS